MPGLASYLQALLIVSNFFGRLNKLKPRKAVAMAIFPIILHFIV